MSNVEDIDTRVDVGEVLPAESAIATTIRAEDLAELLLSYECGIDYKPMKSVGGAGEPGPLDAFPFAASELAARMGYTIQPLLSDPIPEVAKAKAAALRHSTFMLIPGRKFDQYGTRHGKGFGWYDRFLHIAPADWLRVGICSDAQFSTEPLHHQPWDEPMDYVCVVGHSSATCYETPAKKERYGN